MKAALALIRPLDRSTGARIDVRAADAPLADFYGLGGQAWAPAISRRPTLTQELMSPDMNGKVQAGTARLEIDLRQLPSPIYAESLYWRAAPITLLTDRALDDGGADPEFVGLVTSATTDRDTGKLTIEAKVSTVLIEKPLLTLEFDGGGGLGGDAAKRGTLRPAGFGSVPNIEPVWFDTVRNIGQIDGYGNTVSVGWAGEGLSSFGARVADYPSYAALAAAIDSKAVKPGQWATSVADGCIGLGAPPVGIVTCHAIFGTNRPGAMMKRWIFTHAAVPAAAVDTAAFDALDAIVPRAVHYWTSTQRQVSELLEAMSASCNATPLVTFKGKVSVTRAIGGALAGTLDRSGSVEPRVLNWRSADSDAPFYQLKARTARPATVLTYDQVLYADEIGDKGLFHPGDVYRQGNIVWLKDGSQWLYINAVAEAGHVPPVGTEGDAWWQNMQPATKATDILYDDGRSLEQLKPAAPGATPGAPDGTTIGGTLNPDGTVTGGRPSLTAVRAIDLTAANLIQMGLRQDDAQTILNARTFVQGQPVGTFVMSFVNQVTEDNRAIYSAIDLVGARTEDAIGSILDLESVVVEGNNVTTRRVEELSTSNENLTVKVQQAYEAIIGDDGQTGYARALWAVDVNGVAAGLVLASDGTRASIKFSAADFAFVDDSDPAHPITPFYITGGKVYAPNLYVQNLVAGSVTAESIRSDEITNTTFASFPDVAIVSSESDLINTLITVGDDVDGKAAILVMFTQDGSAREDTAATVRAYVTLPGQGEVMVREAQQGVVVSGAKGYWVLPVMFAFPVMGNGQVRVRVTATGYGGLRGSYTSGSVARQIQMLTFAGTR